MRETRFKQTEIGLIPEDWEVTHIGKVCKINTGYRNTQDKKDNGLYPFFVRSEKIEIIDTYSYDCEAVLTAGDGDIGKVFHYVNGKFDLHQRVYIMNEFADKLYGKYFYWYFSHKFFDRVSSMTAKSTVDSVRKEMIADMAIPLPSVEEQTHIATVLNDIDTLISALDKKIEKNKLIKQGAMQQLLTGKKRLPGFKEPWVEKKLGDMAKIKTGTRNGNEAVSNGKYSFFVRSQEVYKINTYAYDEEAILVPGEGNIGKIIHYINGKFDYHQRVYKISNFENVVAKYVYYYLMENFRKQALSNTVKATVDSLRLSTFLNFRMKFPDSLVEQTAIAEILTDMDKEITDLEAKRAKYEQIKYGMMQKLLTGRIRLIDK